MDFDDIPDDVLEEFEDEIREAGGDGGQMAVDEVDWETKFLRPKPKAGGTVAFQWTSIDMYTGDPLATHPRQGQRVPGSRNRPVPVVRLYGVTGDGLPVYCRRP